MSPAVSKNLDASEVKRSFSGAAAIGFITPAAAAAAAAALAAAALGVAADISPAEAAPEDDG